MGDLVRTFTVLNNDVEMPTLGLGVWQMQNGEETERAVRHALDVGYRLIDTAKLYGNEESVGRAVRESGIPRGEIFVTTKLWPTDFMRPGEAFRESLERLGLDYIDLYLIHWPVPLTSKSVWQALEKIYEQKWTRAIGVSNFSTAQIRSLLRHATVKPAVNQIEFHPFSFEKKLLDFCTESRITIEAYSPLARGSRMRDAAILSVAEKNGKTPAQVMLRWALQHGTVAIPKSSNPQRIEENFAVYDWELDDEDMRKLDSLS